MGKVAPPLIFADEDSYQAREYRLEQQKAINDNAGALPFVNLDFNNSNLTSLTTRLHNQLQAIQGGTSGEFYHLTAAQYAATTGVVKLTVLGAGTISQGTGATVTKVSTGVFTITLTTPQATAEYRIQVSSNILATVSSPTTTSFQVNTYSLAGAATDPVRFYVTIS